MSGNNGIAASRSSAGWTRRGPGPWRGPVYAAAVILPREVEIPGLNDSKKLTPKKRDALYDQITAAAVSYSVASVSGGGDRRAGHPQRTDAGDAAGHRRPLCNAGPVPHRRQPGPRQLSGHRGPPTSASWAGTGRAPPSPPPPSWPRSAGTGTSPTCWAGNTPSISSRGTRATERSSTMKCWTGTAPARSTGGPF